MVLPAAGCCSVLISSLPPYPSRYDVSAARAPGLPFAVHARRVLHGTLMTTLGRS